MRIHAQGIRKAFGSAPPALHDVNLTVQEGELLVLLGPSGSGKTTLLHAIAGLTPVDSGRVLLGDDDVTTLPPERRRVPVVFQRHALFPHLTVLDNVAFGLRMARVPRAERERRAREALHDVRIPSVETRYPAELSGGEAQRVAIARALVTKPRALLLDEPFSSLDATLRHEMQEFLLDLHTRAPVTTLFVTHDQREALRLGDRVAVLFDGRIHQVDQPRTLYEEPRDARIATFLGAPNVLPATIAHDRVTVPGLGPIPHRTRAKTLPDGAGTVMIRPEDVQLTAPHGDGAAGVIARVVDRGETTAYHVHLKDGGTLHATSLGPPRHHVGDAVSATLTRPAWVLPS